MKRFLKVLITFALFIDIVFSQAAFASNSEPSAGKPVLKFRSEGKFRIMMINDTQDTDKTLKDTLMLLENALDKLKPDLVVLAGDNIAGYWLGVDEGKVKKAIDNIVGPIDRRNIPFAVVFGNHDQESGVPKETQMRMYMSYKNCLALDEGSSLSNCGTYNLLIKDSSGEKNIFNIWLMDSGTSANGGGYQSVNPDQIKWYRETSSYLKTENGGKPLPSILFQHIPVPEIYDLLSSVSKDTKDSIEGYRTQSENYFILDNAVTVGKLTEAPCSPDKNSGEYAAWVSQGDILGAYFGHDHVNDFMGATKDGLDLGYSPGAGFYQYGSGVYRGVRIFDLDAKDLTAYKTEVVYYKDLVAPKAGISIFDSYFVCELRVAIPVLLTAIIIFLFLVLCFLTVGRKLRDKNKRRRETPV